MDKKLVLIPITIVVIVIAGVYFYSQFIIQDASKVIARSLNILEYQIDTSPYAFFMVCEVENPSDSFLTVSFGLNVYFGDRLFTYLESEAMSIQPHSSRTFELMTVLESVKIEELNAGFYDGPMRVTGSLYAEGVGFIFPVTAIQSFDVHPMMQN